MHLKTIHVVQELAMCAYIYIKDLPFCLKFAQRVMYAFSFKWENGR